MPTTMRAVVLSAQTDPLSVKIEERPIPTPWPGSVVVQILGVQVADFQRQVLTGARGYPLEMPLTPGGNGIGRVTAVGLDATSLKIGQLVYIDAYVLARDNTDVGFLLGFHSGAELGAKKLAGGIWRDGTNAEYANIPIENVHTLDEQKLCGELGYSYDDLLTINSCCIAYGGLNDANVKAGDTVIVAPSTGTFGGAVVLTALAMGANVIACGRSQQRLDSLANSLGTPAQLKTAVMAGDVEKDTALLNDLAGAPGADVFVDFSPPEAAEGGKTPPHIISAIGALRSRGTAVFMGGTWGLVQIPYGLIMFKSLVIRGKFMYDRTQVKRLIKLAEQGRLKLGKAAGKEVVGAFSLDDYVEALEVAEKNPGYENVVVLRP
jgi:threonine dehydrogenase-like Zn-dependent dehydrogenase